MPYKLKPEHEQRLRQLLTVFLEENTKLNLTALRTEDACWTGNILDSVAFMDLIDQKSIEMPTSLLDLGTGGGFPLLPLSIMLPHARCVGLDSTGKKVEAVRRIVSALNLSNVELVNNRAEITGHDAAYRETFDVVTSRAVAPLRTLLEYAVPFTRVHGHVVLWKSMHIEQELLESDMAQKKLHCELVHTHTYDLDIVKQTSEEKSWGVRQLLVFRKNGKTPEKYPREVGEAKTDPI